jgi:hypothetical protein
MSGLWPDHTSQWLLGRQQTPEDPREAVRTFPAVVVLSKTWGSRKYQASSWLTIS